MRGFYEQFFEVYDSITKLYFLKSVGDDFHIKETFINLCDVKDNIFFNYTGPYLEFNFFIDYNRMQLCIDLNSAEIIYFYNYMNKLKLNLDKIKEEYDKQIAAQVCEELKQS